MNAPARPSVRPAAGFSLVEIMVALLVSLFLLAGVLQLYLGNQQTSRLGTGIGLSIVSTILKAHDMPYGVDCKDGYNIFWFTYFFIFLFFQICYLGISGMLLCTLQYITNPKRYKTKSRKRNHW